MVSCLSMVTKLLYLSIIHLSVQALSSPIKQKAIVIGGGPVGLATALILADEPHCYDVSVFEALAPQKYDPGKAYLYQVDHRGQEFTKRYQDLHKRLHSKGIPSQNTASVMVRIPADKDTPISAPVNTLATGNDEKKKTIEEEDKMASYWIPRHTMTNTLLDEIKERSKTKNNEKGKIEFFSGNECISLVAEGGSLIKAKIRDIETNKICEYDAKLVVGADGVNSKVRECLATESEAFSSWKNVKHSKFVPKKWVSPSTALQLKALQIPPQFEIPNTNGTSITSKSETIYVMESVNKKPRDTVRMGLLPMKNNDEVRPGNIITRPDHEIWSITDGTEMRKWFQKAFPRFDFGEDGLISKEEWDRFAKAKGLSFPHCQYTPALQASSNDGECGIVLIGDAIHSFPPDIGQGINSGFEDVNVLDKALRSGGDDMKSLGSRLALYEKERLPDVKALIRFVRHGFPYQYRQSHRIDVIARKFSVGKIILRAVLNKFTFGLIPKASVMYLSEPNMSYSQIMRRADISSTGLRLAFFLGIFWYLKKFLFIA